MNFNLNNFQQVSSDSNTRLHNFLIFEFLLRQPITSRHPYNMFPATANDLIINNLCHFEDFSLVELGSADANTFEGSFPFLLSKGGNFIVEKKKTVR